MADGLNQRLFDFINNSPSVYHVVENLRRELAENNYTELSEAKQWKLQEGGRYFFTRNGSSIIAFRIPEGQPSGFMISAAHSDSPTFKIKENPEKKGAHYVQLNTEKYGGMLMASWFDRPLSVAGRVTVWEDGKIVTKLVNVDRDLLIIPNVAIHMNRDANNGMKYQANIDTLPLIGSENASGKLMQEVAKAAGVCEKDILGTDLFLCCRQKGTELGIDGEYIVSPKLDDLECALGCMAGFISADDSQSISVCCIFDNEEVGSETKQGAASSLLRDTLRRICLALGYNEEIYQMLLAQSLLVSADNAHAQHPNHPEYADGDNCPYMNQGVVIKYNANQRYATDAVSAAVFESICRDVGVPVQSFANRSDMAGGSTLGSIAGTLVPVRTVDIGLAQLAMHSAVETAGAKDFGYLTRAMEAFHSKSLHLIDGGIEIFPDVFPTSPEERISRYI